jgi:hypothetical protein
MHKMPFARRWPGAARWATFALLAALLAACTGRAQPTPAPTALPNATPPPATAATAANPGASPAPAARGPLDLTILHTNDARGEVDPCG